MLYEVEAILERIVDGAKVHELFGKAVHIRRGVEMVQRIPVI